MPRLSSLGLLNAINFGIATSVKNTIYDYIATSSYTSNSTRIYRFLEGFIEGYSPIQLFVFKSGRAVSFSPNNTDIIVSNDISGVKAFPFNKISGTSSGTEYSNPNTVSASSGSSASFNNTGTAVVTDSQSSPYAIAYGFTQGVGWGTKYANPATLPPYCAYACFNPTGTMVAMSVNAAPRVYLYAWSAGWGTKYANPSTAVSYQITTIAFTTSSLILGMYTGDLNKVQPTICGYSISGGFSTKFAAPDSAFNGTFANNVTVNTNEDVLLVAVGSSTVACSLTSYSFGTKYADDTTNMSANSYSFDSTGANVAYACSNLDIKARKWSSGWGTVYSSPASNPASSSDGVAFTK